MAEVPNQINPVLQDIKRREQLYVKRILGRLTLQV